MLLGCIKPDRFKKNNSLFFYFSYEFFFIGLFSQNIFGIIGAI